MTATHDFVLTRPPETDDELYHLVWALWGVRIPRTRVCPDHQAPFEAFADAFFGRSPVSVWKASRGFGGKSRTLAYLVLTEAVVLGAEANLLGGSYAQSTNIHEAMRDGWESPLAPKHMVAHDGATILRLTNGSKVRPLTASQRTVRGPHPQRLRLDEIDEMDIGILDSAMGQPMPKTINGHFIDTQVVMSSTHQYPDKTMTEILYRAADKGWPVFSWCYKETSNPVDGWLSPKTIERKKREVSAHMFAVEYDLQEPSMGNRAIDTETVEQMFSGLAKDENGEYVYPVVTDESGEVSPKVYHVMRGQTEQYEFEEPLPHGDYITATDWAQQVDYTVISTWRVDVKPWRLVAYSRGHRMPWPVMVRWMDKRLERYGGKAIHDATGVGGVVKDYLEQNTKIRPFLMTGRQRDDMLTEYVAAVERGDLVAPRIESCYAEHKYVTNDDLYRTGEKFHLPDTVCSFALAWQMRNRTPAGVRPIIDLTRTSSWRNVS